jgi:hypothetical protein
MPATPGTPVTCKTIGCSKIKNDSNSGDADTTRKASKRKVSIATAGTSTARDVGQSRATTTGTPATIWTPATAILYM